MFKKIDLNCIGESLQQALLNPYRFPKFLDEKILSTLALPDKIIPLIRSCLIANLCLRPFAYANGRLSTLLFSPFINKACLVYYFMLFLDIVWERKVLCFMMI